MPSSCLRVNLGVCSVEVSDALARSSLCVITREIYAAQIHRHRRAWTSFFINLASFLLTGWST